ncbi:hypothetical protein BQ8482_111678 [Mesorhizobium delmotii]|uniref:Uncharacterized protein n=1 Tax=Mesorhizobium delmotii TaxID=1631247 RepID=A0A2P9AF58_9HYPH|nr:hypothetical protein BQ8482_111678 [Mesorhizobium delmotii]
MRDDFLASAVFHWTHSPGSFELSIFCCRPLWKLSESQVYFVAFDGRHRAVLRTGLWSTLFDVIAQSLPSFYDIRFVGVTAARAVGEAVSYEPDKQDLQVEAACAGCPNKRPISIEEILYSVYRPTARKSESVFQKGSCAEPKSWSVFACPNGAIYRGSPTVLSRYWVSAQTR